jgi:hypothetical protein
MSRAQVDETPSTGINGVVKQHGEKGPAKGE